MESEPEESRVVIDICEENYLVWDAADVMNLRKKHRIVGHCVGSLSWKPRQNIQNSLPLQISKIEAAFLLHRRIAVLRNLDSYPPEIFSCERKKLIEQQRLEQKQAQTKILQQQKSIELDFLSSKILCGKKAKRMKMNSEPLSNGASSSETPTTESFSVFKNSELRKTGKSKHNQLWIKMDIASSFNNILSIIDNYEYNLTIDEKLQYEVFCDLHDQGFYVANGNKFGGHFLVYPGDPVAYHSFYIALCVPHNEQLSGYKYSAFGRLASTVKKTLLLCSKCESGKITYLSMSWTGIVP